MVRAVMTATVIAVLIATGLAVAGEIGHGAVSERGLLDLLLLRESVRRSAAPAPSERAAGASTSVTSPTDPHASARTLGLVGALAPAPPSSNE